VLGIAGELTKKNHGFTKKIMAELAENMVIFIVGFVQPKRSRSPKH
jgi:hypothetical protein